MDKLIAASIILICLVIDLITDLSAKRDVLTGKWNVNHKRGVICRIVAAIPATIIYWPSLMLWVTYMVVFNEVISLKIYGRLGVTGQTAWLDRLFLRYHWMKWAAYGGGVVGLIIYIWL